MRKVLFLLIILTISAQAKHLYSEKEYQTYWCNAHKGKMEALLNDNTRVDCLTNTLAVEFDFANKWHECIGQALYYGKKTKRIPACVLIAEDLKKDAKYVRRMRYTVYDKKKIPQFRTFTITPAVFNK